jgi:hypothetical protein
MAPSSIQTVNEPRCVGLVSGIFGPELIGVNVCFEASLQAPISWLENCEIF